MIEKLKFKTRPPSFLDIITAQSKKRDLMRKKRRKKLPKPDEPTDKNMMTMVRGRKGAGKTRGFGPSLQTGSRFSPDIGTPAATAA